MVGRIGTTETEAHERLRRLIALKDWGERLDLVSEEIDRIQQLEPALQDRELAVRGSIFVCEFVNHYRCDDCDESWSDAWCATCDDECPRCGRPFEPEDSEVVHVEALRINLDRCKACGETHES